MHKIVCSLCQKEDEVPFEPRPGSTVMCRSCWAIKRDLDKEQKAKKGPPRKRHGTRVMLPIVCAGCGEEAVLDYIPKGTPIEEALCPNCAAERFGKGSRWAEIQREKEREQRTEWEFVCGECGRGGTLKFRPRPGESYLCVRCYNEHEEPSKERLEGKERLGKDVFIRKRRDS